jgi:hypothetical protein
MSSFHHKVRCLLAFATLIASATPICAQQGYIGVLDGVIDGFREGAFTGLEDRIEQAYRWSWPEGVIAVRWFMASGTGWPLAC